jgi:hypothetical protein
MAIIEGIHGAIHNGLQWFVVVGPCFLWLKRSHLALENPQHSLRKKRKCSLREVVGEDKLGMKMDIRERG